jgi:hypothetical protein
MDGKGKQVSRMQKATWPLKRVMCDDATTDDSWSTVLHYWYSISGIYSIIFQSQILKNKNVLHTCKRNLNR